MFAKLIIRQQRSTAPDNPIDLGFTAEAMLYYGDVELVMHQGILTQLLRVCGPDTLIELIEEGFLNLTFQVNNLGIRTENTGMRDELHAPVVFQIQERSGAPVGLERFVPEAFIKAVGRGGRGRRLARRLMTRVSKEEIPGDIVAAVKGDFEQTDFVEASAIDVVRHYTPEYILPNAPRFRLESAGGFYRVQTNLDFAAINELYRDRVPPSHSSLTPAYILSHLLTARETAQGAASGVAEIATDPVHSLIISRGMEEVVSRRKRSARQLDHFHAFVFDDSRAVREAINSGEKGFSDLLPVLRRARDFRKWLKDKPESTDLVKAYFREVTAGSWIDKLPGKAARWTIFTVAGATLDALGAGGLGTATGLALSGADAFLLDRIIKGWRPNQFVDGPLRKFVSKRDKSG